MAIPIAILVNVAMLLTRMTRVVNVDIWNIWHMTFTGALLHLATGSWMIGMAGVVIHAAFVYKLGDWFARDTRNFFELEGIAIPHGTSAYMGPIAVLVDAIIENRALTVLNLAPTIFSANLVRLASLSPWVL